MPEAIADTEILDEIVRRIVEVADPDKIILFGSRARGDARPDSDYDILVIAPSGQPHYERTVPIYMAMDGIVIPYEIVWWTPDEVARWRGAKSFFVTTAIREGEVLYERAA